MMFLLVVWGLIQTSDCRNIMRKLKTTMKIPSQDTTGTI